MSRTLTFSRTFPAKHPHAGEPTFFVEKILKSLDPKLSGVGATGFASAHLSKITNFDVFTNCLPKRHTIRAGKRWKAGDIFSPRVWSGKPYCSKQITLVSDIEVKKVWHFEIDENGVYIIDGKYIKDAEYFKLAQNDGLSDVDLAFWFMPNLGKPNAKIKPFSGQIICWDDTVNY